MFLVVNPELSLDFTKKLEATHYSTALAVSGAWGGNFTRNWDRKTSIIEDYTDQRLMFSNQAK